MRKEFKAWLTLHKGKPLDKALISMISEYHEGEILNMLCNEGFVLEDTDSSKTISSGENKDWAVYDNSLSPEREFNTLAGAIKYIKKQ